MAHRYLAYILVSVLMLSGTGWSQTEEQGERPRLQMRSADFYNIVGEGENEIHHLNGNVQFVQGDAYITCRRATYSRFNQTAMFYGPVTIFDGERTLHSDKVNYNGKLQTEEAFGNVVLLSKNHRLTADYVKYDQEAETAEASRNVVIDDLIEQIHLTGMNGFYNRNNQYGRLEGRASMTKIDTAAQDTLTIYGRVIEAWGDSNLVRVEDSVRIERAKLRAECGELHFLSEQDSMILEDQPVVWQENQRMSGDTIAILMPDMELKKGWIRGNGKIESTDTTSQDVMTGKSISLVVESDSLRRIVVSGQATSVYHVDDSEKGVNSFTGDIIRMVFHGEKLHRLFVESRPGSSTGTFIPEIRPTRTTVDSTAIKGRNSK